MSRPTRLAGSRALDLSYAAVTPCGAPFQVLRLSSTFLTLPGGLLPFRSPLLRESLLISFPGLLRWFTSPSFASVPYFIQVFRCWNRSQRVTPFGYLRLIEYVLLPAAFRSLSRPSSPYSSIGIRHRPIFRLTILFFLFRICILSAALMPSSPAFLPLACNATPSPY